jgi:predicted DNA-binding protein
MARPKKDEALGASEFIGIRVSPAMRESLEDAAKRNGTTIATEARNAIDRGLKRKGTK